MSEIVTERSGSILSIQFNRPEKKNALTMSMYDTVAELLNAAAGDDGIRVVLLHGAGDSFSAGNDLGDFLKNPPKGYDSPQGRFIDALNNFDKPLTAAAAKIEIQEFVSRLQSADAKEALTAFFDKRKPDFSRTTTAPQAINQ